ncbi:MAG: SGNH/GDSL hydrolase family protein [Clostridiales bacterium]|nr:SGNH/GDSL hydrolase family protein [Clostridiales bacterium]
MKIKELKFIRTGAALLLSSALFLTACGGTASSTAGSGTESAGAEVTETEATSAAADTEEGQQETASTYVAATCPTSYVSDDEYALATEWNSCDDTALAAVMKKAAAGEPVTIALIGGSITQGTISSGSIDSEVETKEDYADRFCDWWSETFPDTEFTFINAGIGGTDSYLGVHRVEEDVLQYSPDLVLVEFSVNDSDSTTYEKTYDNLVRKILKSDSSPAVMLLFMGQTNGATAQAKHLLVGFNYALPMVSYYNVIKDMMDNGVYSAEELSGDEVHPSSLGHAITGEILWKYLSNVYAGMDSYGDPEPFTADPVTSEKYMDAQILDSNDVTPDDLGTFAESDACYQYPNGWQTEEGDGGITFTATFQNLGILYYAMTNGLSGQFDIYVDGEAVYKIDADFSGGWGNAIEAKEVYSSDAAAEHTVEIRKADGSTGDVFTLLGLMVS